MNGEGQRGSLADLGGKTALVTGAGSGIGRAIALHFADCGASVGLLDIDGAAAASVHEEIAARGGRAAPWAVNIRDAGVVDDLLLAIDRDLGPVDILVNNAGIRDLSPCLDLSLADWNAVLDVNVTGAFLYAQATARRMRERGSDGVLLAIASVAGLIAVPNRTAYVASKHALIGLTKSLAWELGAHGIRANAIVPAGVDTPMAAETLARYPETAAAIRRTCPMGRMAHPEELAQLAAYLASDAAGFINGAVLSIDGGFMAGRNL